MSFLVRAGLVIALVYALSPLSDGPPRAPAERLAAEAQAAVRREAQNLAAAALERCRRDAAKCLEAAARTGSIPLPPAVPSR
jgi:hypothetical protein